MTSNAAALPLPGWRDPLDKILKRLADGQGRRASGLTCLEKIARRVPCRPTSPAYAAACLEVLETRVNCPPEHLAHIPPHGPLLLYANHPSGALEGLIMAALCGDVRPDLKILANDALLALPQLAPMLLPLDLTGRGKNRNATVLRQAVLHLRRGGALGLFPAGRVARWRPGRGLTEEPWLPLLGRLSRCAGSHAPDSLRLLPLSFKVRVSPLFLATSHCNDALAGALLPRVLCGQRRSRAGMRVGLPISASGLAGLDNAQRSQCLRLCHAALADAGRPARAARCRPLAPAQGPAAFMAALAALPSNRRLTDDGRYGVYLLQGHESPPLLDVLTRRREEAFRALGEGCGRERDQDRYDAQYEHLLLVDEKRQALAGAYRTRLVRPEQARTCTQDTLYTASLFRFKAEFFRQCGTALELGRAFVSNEYQRDYAPLLLLWKGIGQLVLRYGVRTLFGPSSIGLNYRPQSVDLLWRHLRLRHWHAPLADLVEGRRPRALREELPFARGLDYAAVNNLVRQMEGGRALPILFKHYLQLGGRIAAFHEDRRFGTLDALLVVDLLNVPDKLLRRYVGDEGLQRLRDRMWYA